MSWSALFWTALSRIGDVSVEREEKCADCTRLAPGDCDFRLDVEDLLRLVVCKARVGIFRALSSKVPSISVSGSS